MDVNQFLEHHNEPNRQVKEEDKSEVLSGRSSARIENEVSIGKSALEARVQALKQTITALKNELLEEKALWKKEVELMTSLVSTSEKYLEGEFSLEAEADLKNGVGSSTDPLTSPLIRDYEEKLVRYQGALAQAQAEKRMNIRRQIAANTYRKRLNEVEKLCQEELVKVRETATHLEPLKQIALEWDKAKPQHEKPKPLPGEKSKGRRPGSVECGGDFLPLKAKDSRVQAEVPYEVPVKQIDASLVVDEDAANEIKGKIVFQIGSLPTEVPTICYSAKFE